MYLIVGLVLALTVVILALCYLKMSRPKNDEHVKYISKLCEVAPKDWAYHWYEERGLPSKYIHNDLKLTLHYDDYENLKYIISNFAGKLSKKDSLLIVKKISKTREKQTYQNIIEKIIEN